ncbi:MAG: tRNA (adenosine(37)-N6)-threonylcarbamoyltransferase complex transferase subunit TsaD, partial [Lachnospiraceae bacterium]|nr:tRNA (adenosine(37)-N6)-threonylcarbamoyltransferase complex transferase subunit TsaD [Lachnospiraceae bacterium]
FYGNGYYLNSCEMKGETISVPDVAASFQEAVVDVLVTHAMEAVREYDIKDFALAGGVASNTALRGRMEEACKEAGVNFYCPPPVLCTDNAAMIACAGYHEYLAGRFADMRLNAVPSLPLGTRQEMR